MDWQKTFFYCKDTSPAGEPKLPLFSEDRLQATPLMKARCSEVARPRVESLITRIRALLSHNLENMDLVRCWTTWRIQPLSPRTRLICSYTRCAGDDLRVTEQLSDGPELGRLIKKLTGKPVKDQAHFGLQPFCSTNPAPDVSLELYLTSNLILLVSLTNSFSLTLLQLTDSFWKPASGAGTEDKTEAEAEAEAEVEEETPATDQTAVAEDTDNDDEESSQEAPAEDDAADEESSPEAPTKNVIEEESSQEAPIVEDTDDDESSPAAPVTKQTDTTSAAAQPSLSEESSAKSHSSSSPASNNNGSREAIPKVPLSRVLGSTRSPAKPEEHMQSVIAARKRKLRSDGPADAPEPLPVSHQRKSTSPPHKDDSYHSGMSMPSSDSQASLDLETNVG